MMFADVPDGGQECADESAGKNAAGLQRADAENVGRMRDVGTPVIDDVQDFRANNAAQHDQDAEVPCLVGIDALPGGVAHADPQANQNAGGDQEAVGRKEKAAGMEKLRVHRLLDGVPDYFSRTFARVCNGGGADDWSQWSRKLMLVW